MLHCNKLIQTITASMLLKTNLLQGIIFLNFKMVFFLIYGQHAKTLIKQKQKKNLFPIMQVEN